MSAENACETTKSTGVDPQKVIEKLKPGKGLHDKLAERFKDQYQIRNKLMSEWQEHFAVKLPPDMNPRLCQEVDRELTDRHHEAILYKAQAEAKLSAYRSVLQNQTRSSYAQLVNEYKAKNQKLPAKDTLTMLAEEQNSDMINALVHAEIELAFWKEIIADLYYIRKIVENVTINLSVEAKALGHQQYINSLTSNKD